MNASSFADSATHIPPGLLFQWHITERCNLRCTHCYQEKPSADELDFAGLLEILDQFKSLLARWRTRMSPDPVRGHITLSGGEPFVRKDFWRLLDVFHECRNLFSFAVLTNGTRIDEDAARILASMNPAFVQISIEGPREAHEKIRGAGTFDRAVHGVRRLVKNRIRTFISFTAHRNNFRSFPDVARLGRRLKADRVWADRLIPLGSGAEMSDLLLTPEETRKFFEIMLRERGRARRSWFGRTEISMHRALQFLLAGGRPYHCTAGDSLVTVMPNGDLYPCRRMPVRVGNLLETPLETLYRESPLFRELRDRERGIESCEGCSFERLCRGGLKCLSHAVSGDPFGGDPGCWRRQPASE